MNCAKCGSEALVNEKFCMNCGNPLTEQINSQSNQNVANAYVEPTPAVDSAPVYETVTEPKKKKGISVIGTVLIALFLLLSMSTTLFSWSSWDYFYSYDYEAEYGSKPMKSGLVDLYRSAENAMEYVDEEIQWEKEAVEDGYRDNTLQYEHLWRLKNGMTAIKIISMIAIIAILVSFVLLLISAIMVTREIKSAKIFSLIGGIIMALVSGAYAVIMPMLESIYQRAVVLENSIGVYIIIAISLAIAVVSIFYKGKKKAN